jgi:hypothetical protein
MMNTNAVQSESRWGLFYIGGSIQISDLEDWIWRRATWNDLYRFWKDTYSSSTDYLRSLDLEEWNKNADLWEDILEARQLASVPLPSFDHEPTARRRYDRVLWTVNDWSGKHHRNTLWEVQALPICPGQTWPDGCSTESRAPDLSPTGEWWNEFESFKFILEYLLR